ncbi:MAG: hypothetical protein Q8J89_08735 [Caulobacter sp.]|nr:hypothetical protein [Caulobacter sp.]
MRLFTTVALAAAMLAGPALADPMATAYGNTVVITYGDGTTVNLYVNEDGTYTGSSPMGESAGTWAVSGNQTCFTQSSPEPGEPSCSKTVSKNVGDSWQSTGQGGAPVTVTIQEGR